MKRYNIYPAAHVAIALSIITLLSNCSKKANETRGTAKLKGPFSWHGECQYGYWSTNKPPHSGQTYYKNNIPLTDKFGFVIVSESTVMLLNNTQLAVDTAVFKVYRDDDATLELALVRNVPKRYHTYPFSPYNKFLDTLVYYKAGDSIVLSSGNRAGGYYASYIWLATR